MHGMIMVIYLLTALFLGGFGNYLIPLMVGARDMVFPYVNMLSYWVYLLAVVVLASTFFVPGGPTGAGWTLYPPQAILSGTPGQDWGIILMMASLILFIIGAGIAGMYQLYRLREQGLKVKAVEAGDNVGGTWYWNRYPGARVDSPSHVYQYWFSKELNDEWSWSERFPAQPETERYLNFVADRFDLRKDIQFKTRVTAASFDKAIKRWSITTDEGETF